MFFGEVRFYGALDLISVFLRLTHRNYVTRMDITITNGHHALYDTNLNFPKILSHAAEFI